MQRPCVGAWRALLGWWTRGRGLPPTWPPTHSWTRPAGWQPQQHPCTNRTTNSSYRTSSNNHIRQEQKQLHHLPVSVAACLEDGRCLRHLPWCPRSALRRQGPWSHPPALA